MDSLVFFQVIGREDYKQAEEETHKRKGNVVMNWSDPATG